MAIARRKRRNRLLFDIQDFPKLNNANHRVTSDPVEEQNCIAFAAGDKIHFWWPVPDFPLKSPYFWPKSCPLESTVEAFVCAYKIVGFEKCEPSEEGKLDDGWEKIAIFVLDVTDNMGASYKEPQHAAIQSPLRNGKWRSKMGDEEDIEHDLHDLEGRNYGRVEFFMKRTLAAKKSATAMLKKRIESH